MLDIPLVEAEFNSLEEKVAQFVSLCERLRAENNDLKRELATLRNDAKRLHDKKIGRASCRERVSNCV